MIYNEHSNLRGKHALFSPSGYSWMNYDEDDAIRKYCASYAPSVGTVLHAYTEDCIRYGTKLGRYDKKHILLELMRGGIPTAVIDRLPIDDIFENLVPYVNDGIGFRMTPEVPLYYSDLCFGHADALCYDEREKFLRIHDLKTGTTPAKIDQLIAYDALFRLEYCPLLRVRPEEISSELRIYQNGEIVYCTPSSDDIITVMEQIKTLDKTVTYLQ